MRAARFLAVAALAAAFAVLPSNARSWWRQFDPWLASTGTVTMQLQLGSSGGTLIDGSADWGESAERALNEWNKHIRNLQFRVVRNSSASIASANGSNNVFFSSSVFGRSFNDYASPTQTGGIVAVSLYWLTNGVRTESDVVFNNALSWNSYSGTYRNTATGALLNEFYRTSLHEFGHTLGLDHPNDHGQTVAAVMNSILGPEYLTVDDIDGAQSYYGALTTAPGAPSGLTATTSGTSLTLAWNTPSGGAPWAYRIEAGTSSGSTNLQNFSTGNTGTSYAGTRFSAGTYYVRVRATNTAGTSAVSNEVVVNGSTTPAAPGAPSGLTGTVSGSTVTLTWVAPATGGTPTAYTLEAGSSSGSANLANFSTGNTATTYSTSGVAPGTYYVRVRAQNSIGTSAASNEVVITVGSTTPPAACTSAPNSPTGLTMTISGSTVTLTWTAPVGGCEPASYVLRAGSATGLSDLANVNTGSTSTTYVATGVPAGNYYVRVLAANASGLLSLASNTVLVPVTTTGTVPAPAPAPGPTPTGGKFDGTYDFFFQYPELQAGNRVVIVGRPLAGYFKVTNGVISSTDGALRGTVDPTFGNATFTSLCPFGGKDPATWTGILNTLSGPKFGEGRYSCVESPPYDWSVTNGR